MEKKEALISIVIPVRNRAGVVGATLDSIAAQTFKSFELIIVDNNSSDGTPEILESWKQDNATCGIAVRLVKCATPGAAAARNAGMAFASATWIMFFDSDDIMLPWHLQKVADGIKTHPQADIIGWDVQLESIGGRKRRGQFFGRVLQHHNLFNGAMATQRWVARTEFVKAAGGWDEAVGYWDDIELGARMLARTGNVSYIGRGGVRVIESSDSITAGGARDPWSGEAALTRIEKTLGARGRRWCRLKRAVEYALASRAGLSDGMSCMKAMKPSALLWAAYFYTRLGGRGVTRLMIF